MPICEESCSLPEDLRAPAHNPSAPPHEAFDISTTVDPSFVISLIRKLVPSDLKDGENTIESGLHEEEPKSEGIEENAIHVSENGESDAMVIVDNVGEENGPKTINGKQHQGVLTQEKTWEECGCILWDLAASEDHARLMAQNLVIDVLLANLMVSKSARITEISLGIIGNLACHEIIRKQISCSNGLVKVIVDQLFLDDVPSLCEAFRVITTFLQNSDGCVIWAEELQTEQTLSRIMWISENTLNRKLIEKSTRFLFDVLYCQQVAAILLPPMMKLGLSSLLINLLDFEMSKFREEEKPESDEVLDCILLSIEALSVMDDHLEEIYFNKQLLQLLGDLIKFNDKFEIPDACVTASTLLAKIVTDETNLALEMSQDLDVLQGLLDAFPFADGSVLTQASMWSIIARLLTLVRESEVSSSFLNRLVSILIRKFDLLEEEIAIRLLDDMDDDPPPTAYVDALVIGIKRICCILTQWKLFDDEMKHTASTEGCHVREEDVDKLLEICSKAFILYSRTSRESCSAFEELPAPANNPSAPPHESFEISTVDPSSVISLIRKLLPSDVKDGRNACESDLHEKEPKSEGIEENAVHVSENGEFKAKETVDNCGKPNGPKTIAEKQCQGVLAREKTWEEYGCILQNLAKREDQARLMAQNLIVDVLLANLVVSQSARITEICLGIIENLAWHEISWNQICSSNGLVKVIVDKLFLDDVPSLCRVCRLIAKGLIGHQYVIWAEALQSGQRLSRILWISEDAPNPCLIKESMYLVFAVVSHEEVATILLPPMVRLGLPSRLINLLACDMSRFHKEQKPNGDEVLEIILLLIEALSVMDDYSEEILLNKELLQLLEELVKFPDKSEIPNACVYASALLAKIVTGDANLASRMSQDLDILQGILDSFLYTDCHLLSQASMWSLIVRLLNIQESEVTSSFLNRLVSILSSKLDLMIEEVDLRLSDDMDYRPTPPPYVDLLSFGLRRIACILTQWRMLDDETRNTASMEGYHINEEDVDQLLQLCADVLL